MPKVKKPSYPNEQFKTMEEYFEFGVSHSEAGAWVFGEEAYRLKKQEDKQKLIPLPKIAKESRRK